MEFPCVAYGNPSPEGLLQIKVYIPLAAPFRCKGMRYVCLLLNNCLHLHVLVAKGT